jgi:hypothetical protein
MCNFNQHVTFKEVGRGDACRAVASNEELEATKAAASRYVKRGGYLRKIWDAPERGQGISYVSLIPQPTPDIAGR